MRTYETKASFGRWDVHATTHDDGWDRVTRALVKEVSILSPAHEPAEPRACVLSFREKADEGEVFYGGPVIRRYFDTPITVRLPAFVSQTALTPHTERGAQPPCDRVRGGRPQDGC